MKALSIKQPWAFLIAHGIKDIENRTWRTNFRGRIYIHASAKWFDGADNLYGLFTPEQSEHLMSKLPFCPDFKKEAKKPDKLIRSAIIGEVDIVDCFINYPSIWAEKSEGVTAGYTFYYDEDVKPVYNWVLANAALYDKPILNVKGRLSFWEFKNNSKINP